MHYHHHKLASNLHDFLSLEQELVRSIEFWRDAR